MALQVSGSVCSVCMRGGVGRVQQRRPLASRLCLRKAANAIRTGPGRPGAGAWERSLLSGTHDEEMQKTLIKDASSILDFFNCFVLLPVTGHPAG